MKYSAQMPESMRFIGHKDAVLSIAISVEGEHVLTGSLDRSARLWSASSGQEVRTFGAPRRFGWQFVTSVDMNHDLRTVLTATRTGIVQLWEFDTARPTVRIEHPSRRLFGKHCMQWRFPAVFAPDGRYILTGSLDQTARIWDAQTGEEMQRIDTSPHGVTAVAFCDDARKVLIGTLSGGVSMWNAGNREEITRYQEPDGPPFIAVTSIEMSPDSRLVLAGGAWPFAQIWDANTAVTLQQYRIDEMTIIESARFSTNSKLVAIGYSQSQVGLWDVATATEIVRFDCRCGRRHLVGGPMPVAFSLCGSYLVVGSARNAALRFDLDGIIK